MSKLRQQRRLAEKLEAKIREKLTYLTESFVSAYLQHSINPDDEALADLLGNKDRDWKHFASRIIRDNPKIYQNKPAKERLLNAFMDFVDKVYNKMSSTLDDKSSIS